MEIQLLERASSVIKTALIVLGHQIQSAFLVKLDSS